MTTSERLYRQLQQLPWWPAIEQTMRRAEHEAWVRRIQQRDGSLWTGQDESQWLGWLNAPARFATVLRAWHALRAEARAERIETILLAGMGGSSLCPLLWQRCFEPSEPPRLRVVDTTVPEQIRRLTADVDWKRTWVIVSSKSGATAETTALGQLFESRLRDAADSWAPPRRTLAITDPGSPLAERAQQAGYRAVVLGDPAVGGRFSAFTPFGLLPAALHGAPTERLIRGAQHAQERCQREKASQNPALLLGIALAEAARHGTDKLTLVASPSIAPLSLWIEQLIAESTGKAGKGIVPIADEPLGPSDAYDADRLFVYLRAEDAAADQDEAFRALREAGAAVLELSISTAEALAEWMYYWEFATAVAGIVLELNPFDQPNVESTKRQTRKLLEEYANTGVLPRPQWLRQGEDLRCFVPATDSVLARTLREANIAAALEQLLQMVRGGRGYLAVNAFVAEEPGVVEEIRWLRRVARDATKRAVAFGYGPRYLHSTGQLHKGGPSNAVFLFLTAEDREDIPVPGTNYSFGVLKEAQAYGDVLALDAAGRAVLWVNLGPDVPAGLARLRIALEEAAGARQ